MDRVCRPGVASASDQVWDDHDVMIIMMLLKMLILQTAALSPAPCVLILINLGRMKSLAGAFHTFDLHTITITKSYLDLNISFLVPLLLSFSSSTSSALSIAALTAQWTAWSPLGPPGTHLPASAACSSQT